jgi:hypothetical protein
MVLTAAAAAWSSKAVTAAASGAGLVIKAEEAN